MPDSLPAGGDSPLIFISAAEPSADLHAAKLIRALHEMQPDARFVGVAGPKMRDAGCEGVFDMTAHAAMLSGAFKVVPQALAMLRASKRTLKRKNVDLAVVIDSPVLNLPVAKYAKQAGVPVLYYIAPQVWAWGKRRVNRVRARVDQLAVILPFEETYFRDHGIPAEYVGHPLFDTLTQRQLDETRAEELRRTGQPMIAILPGSRVHVVEEVFPGQLAVARAIADRHDRAHFCISVANERVRAAVQKHLAVCPLSVSLHENENGEILSAADLTLVASGTATLEVAFYHTPMIVMYNASRWVYEWVGKHVITTPYFSLINILADKALVPEFMPYYRSTDPICAKALELIETPGALAQLRQDIADTMNPMVRTGASESAARIVARMLDGAR